MELWNSMKECIVLYWNELHLIYFHWVHELNVMCCIEWNSTEISVIEWCLHWLDSQWIQWYIKIESHWIQCYFEWNPTDQIYYVTDCLSFLNRWEFPVNWIHQIQLFNNMEFHSIHHNFNPFHFTWGNSIQFHLQYEVSLQFHLIIGNSFPFTVRGRGKPIDWF